MGLVHRDIKPGNIMLCRLGGEVDIAKVLDFGLVQPRGVVMPDEEHGWAGTPGYVAPEVIHGTAADGRADLYALGCVAWWLLTGTRVLPDADGDREAERHCDETPPSLLVVLPDCDPQVAQLIDELLAKEPFSRPASAEAVRRRLMMTRSWDEFDEPSLATFWRDEVPVEVHE